MSITYFIADLHLTAERPDITECLLNKKSCINSLSFFIFFLSIENKWQYFFKIVSGTIFMFFLYAISSGSLAHKEKDALGEIFFWNSIGSGKILFFSNFVAISFFLISDFASI